MARAIQPSDALVPGLAEQLEVGEADSDVSGSGLPFGVTSSTPAARSSSGMSVSMSAGSVLVNVFC